MATESDGKITIDTEIDTSGMKAGSAEIEASARRMAASVSGIGEKTKSAMQKQMDVFSKMNQTYAQQEQKVDALKQKLKEIEDQKVETEEYKKLSSELVALEEEFDKVEAKQREWTEMGFSIDSAPVVELDKELDRIYEKMEKIQNQQKEMRTTGAAYENPQEMPAYQTAGSKLAAEEEKLVQMNGKVWQSYEAIRNKAVEYTKSLIGVDEASKKTSNSANRLGSVFSRTGRSVKNAMGAFSAKTLLKYGLGLRTLFALANKIRSAAVEGVRNLAQYSGGTNAAISSLMSAMTQLKNSFATAFSPILTAVAPILTSFINLLAKAATYVGMFFAALTGQKSFTKAVSVQEDYAASLDKTSTNADKAAKSLKRYKSPLDQINNYETNKNNGSTGAGGNQGVLPSQMFETVPIENSISGLAGKVKEIFAQIFKPFQQAWEREGQATVNAALYALNNLGTLAKSVGLSMLAVWTNGTGVQILSTMLQIAQNLLLTAGNIAARFREAWNTNQVGTQILQGIANICQTVLGFINGIAMATAKWAGSLNFYPLLSAINNLLIAMQPVIQAIGTFLTNLYTTIILPMLTWLIETGIPAVLNAVSGFLTFLSDNQWIIEGVGTALLTAFAAGNIVSMIAKIVGAVSGIIEIISGAGGLLGAIKMLVSAMGGPVPAAITGVITVGVLLYKNWDTICEYATKLYQWVSKKAEQLRQAVVQAFGSLTNWLSSVFHTDWSKQFGALGEILNTFNKSVLDIVDGIKETFSGLIDLIAGTFTGDWKRAWEGVKKIFAGVFKGLVSLAKSPINAIISGFNAVLSVVNGVIRRINSISFKITVPDWIPGIGGSWWGFNGFNIPSIGTIPYLASGAVIPPRSEFLAVLGDQKSGNNIEAPESLLRKIVREESGGVTAGGGQYRFIAQLNRRILFDEMIAEAEIRQMMSGRNPFELA